MWYLSPDPGILENAMRRLLFLGPLLCAPRAAWAVQRHTGEGLVAHVIAHLALAGAFGFLGWRVLRDREARERPLGWGAALFALWSLWALTSHLRPGSWLLERDHLVLVPALWLVWLGLRRMARGEAR